MNVQKLHPDVLITVLTLLSVIADSGSLYDRSIGFLMLPSHENMTLISLNRGYG